MKYGKSLSRFEELRMDVGDDFSRRNRISITQGANAEGMAIAQLSSNSGKDFYHTLNIAGADFNVGQMQDGYRKSLAKMTKFVKASPGGLDYNGMAHGKRQNALDLLLAEDTAGIDILDRNYRQMLANTKNGVLTRKISSKNFFDLFISDKQGAKTATEYVNQKTDRQMYEPLEAYAKELYKCLAARASESGSD